MSDTVIRVENLGKKYVIGRNREAERYTALRDVITNNVKELAGRFKHPNLKPQRSASEDFWALKDVSFEIKQGDHIDAAIPKEAFRKDGGRGKERRTLY